MMTTLSDDHKDALQEFMNISMGRAANRLATLLSLHVTISVPNIRLATEDDLQNFQVCQDDYIYTRQSFFGDMDGELITLLSRSGCRQVVSDFNKAKGGDEEAEISLEENILDISNILSGASLKGLCQQIDARTNIHPPVIFDPSTQILPVSQWKIALIMEISFHIEHAAFSAKTVICFTDTELDRILTHLDELM